MPVMTTDHCLATLSATDFFLTALHSSSLFVLSHWQHLGAYVSIELNWLLPLSAHSVYFLLVFTGYACCIHYAPCCHCLLSETSVYSNWILAMLLCAILSLLTSTTLDLQC